MTATDIELWLAEAWRDLGLEAADAEDDFFALGATSLTAMRLIAKVEERYGEDALAPDDLYERSTLGEVAASIHRNAVPTAGV